jgi:hypothetical protein
MSGAERAAGKNDCVASLRAGINMAALINPYIPMPLDAQRGRASVNYGPSPVKFCSRRRQAVECNQCDDRQQNGPH